MKRLLPVLFLLSSAAFAAPTLPATEVSFVESFEGCKQIVVSPITAADCTMSLDQPDFKSYRCNENVTATLMCNNGTATEFHFTAVHIMHKFWQKKWVSEFVLSTKMGTDFLSLFPQDATIGLSMWYFDEDETSLHGVWGVTNYNVSRTFYGHPVR